MNSEGLREKCGLWFAYQSLKYVVLAIDFVALTVLMLVYLLVPPPPGSLWGNNVAVMQLMLVAVVTSVVAGIILARDARKSVNFSVDVLTSLPVVMGSSVVGIVAFLMALGYVLYMWEKV